MMLSTSACTRFLPILGKLPEIRNKITKAVSVESKEQKSDSGVQEENLLDKIQGYWIVPETFERPTDHEFWCVNGNTLAVGFYCTDFYRQSEVTDITKISDGSFLLSLYFPPVPASELGDAQPASYDTISIRSDDNFEKQMYYINADGTEVKLIFVGKTDKQFYDYCYQTLGF